jgi:hypothetical protein
VMDGVEVLIVIVFSCLVAGLALWLGWIPS